MIPAAPTQRHERGGSQAGRRPEYSFRRPVGLCDTMRIEQWLCGVLQCMALNAGGRSKALAACAGPGRWLS